MTLDDSTIVAIATPVGVGAISIVRLSGKNACEIILRLTHRDSLKARYAHLCRIYDTQGASIDEAIVLYFPAPRSYTTQDVWDGEGPVKYGYQPFKSQGEKDCGAQVRAY